MRRARECKRLTTRKQFGIGQRACLIQTPHGNVLWDLIAYLDQETVDKVRRFGFGFGFAFILVPSELTLTITMMLQ